MMSDDKNKRIKIIGEQCNEEINKLAIKTEKEIQLIANDSASAFETMYRRKPDLLDQMGYYDNLIILFIQNLLILRDVRKKEFTEKISKGNG